MAFKTLSPEVRAKKYERNGSDAARIALSYTGERNFPAMSDITAAKLAKHTNEDEHWKSFTNKVPKTPTGSLGGSQLLQQAGRSGSTPGSPLAITTGSMSHGGTSPKPQTPTSPSGSEWKPANSPFPSPMSEAFSRSYSAKKIEAPTSTENLLGRFTKNAFVHGC
eukprot:TRINITY_DN93490_c0_g1_i1.p1 TRINITY_DN93490_c0_g1~~TRINITY_DN93490_c0_g1_i1.p1  ORF type:complete len:165 (+),score=31.96 TRINITY_DN93490_c0_g1_i1:78-572(+)